jgi:hypothetical protein
MRLTAIDQRLLLLVAIILSSLAGFTAFRAVPAFSEVFQSFSGGLPQSTELVLKFYPGLLALPAIVLLVWALWPRREQRGVAALSAAIALSVAIPLMLVLVMYLPIVALR